ncbi:HNH endonuclease family protein [Nocardioides lentus]|uniref:HNH endonuclease family protein n=1 Tax=Nocardioides lentus TaxID=338077 RepID=A0ABN2PGD2_9ACTN
MSVLACPPAPRPAVRRLRVPLVLLAALAAVLAVLVAAPAPPAAAETYSAPLRTAVRDLPVATEVRTGYSRDLFPHWVDADGDGCDARRETLLQEADDAPTVGSGCSLTGGRWFSYYDRVSVTSATQVSVDHMVPLAEAWDSGARSWTATERRAFANDLGDRRSLVGVTVSANSSKSDSDPAGWQPTYDKCRYIAEFTAVKLRWRLSVDSAERSALISRADSCADTTLTVTRAR